MMFNKKLMALTIMLVSLLAVSAVSAADDYAGDVVGVHETTGEVAGVEEAPVMENADSNEIISEAGSGTFSELQSKIGNATEGSTITLENDYVNDGVLMDGIQISKAITINGNGYAIDAQHKSRIFNITANDVILNNITFINGNATRGGAIYSSGNLTVTDCLFTQNIAESGGAIANRYGDVLVLNCTFIDNAALKFGGAVAAENSTLSVVDSMFEQNSVDDFGGAISGVHATINVGCTAFMNNSANCGGAIDTLNCVLYVLDSAFEDNSAECGGAISNDMDNVSIWNCTFMNNSAGSGGAIDILDCALEVKDSVFEDNSAECGGAIATEDGSVTLGNCTFINNTADHGGASYFYGALNNATITADYIGNTAKQSGGANYFDCELNNALISGDFTDNVAENGSGGANYFQYQVTNVTISGNYKRNMANSNCNASDKTGSGGANCFNETVENLVILGDYTDNMAYRGGANLLNRTSSNVDMIGDYKNNTAILFGGANYFYEALINSTVVGDYISNRATNKGGANFVNRFASHVSISGDYIENSASEGSAIYFNRAMEYVSISGDCINNHGNNTIYMVYRVYSTLTVSDIVFDYDSIGYGEVSFTGATGVDAHVVDQPDAVVNVTDNIIAVSGLDVGTYTLKVTTIPDENHSAVTETATITVNKICSEIIADALVEYTVAQVENDTAIFSLVLMDANGNVLADKPINITFNGVTEEFTTDENGTIGYHVSAGSGTYTLEMEFAGDDWYDESYESSTVIIKPHSEPCKIFLRNALYFVTQTKMVNVTLWDANNRPIAGKTVHITIANLTWSGVTDENGTASIRVGVGFGNHNATVHFDGDDEYAAANRSGVVRVIKETPSVMVRGADTQFNVTINPKVVKVYLWDRTSKPLPTGSKIAIKVNGQTFIGYTDSEGIASIEIGINKTGIFNAEVRYAGNSAYNTVTRIVKFTIS